MAETLEKTTIYRKPIFAECSKCGERWKIGTVPMSLLDMAEVSRNARCPNCAERKRIALCSTVGPDAVIEARDGKEVQP